MRRRALTSLLVVVGVLAIGLAACGDDEGDTDTGPDETATAEFCSGLADLSSVLDQVDAVDDETSITELQTLNGDLGGAIDSLSLAAQGAEVNTDELTVAVQSLQPLITNLAENPSRETLAALSGATDPADGQLATLEQANCQDVPESGA